MGQDIKEIKKFSVKLAEQSGKILMKNYKKIRFVRSKGLNDYYTNVDLESEKFILSSIKKEFPGHSIVSEESGSLNKSSDFKWHIDPLDGTHNYIANLPMFGVSIALAYKDEVKIGVINLPYFNELYIAEKGKGSFLNGKRINVSKTEKLSNSFVFMDLFLRYKAKNKMALLDKIKGKIQNFRSPGCAVYEYTNVARGNIDAYIAASTNSWDIAAGALIVEEANGKVTDFKARKWKPENGNFIASNKKIHSQLLKALK